MPLYNFIFASRAQRITIPAGFNPQATVYLWGAGGGAGGDDNPGAGGAGACGNAIKIVLNLSAGDVLEFGIGDKGTAGTNGKRTAGGAAGASYIDTSNNRYGGGTGGPCGARGSSGSGGGGGGATVLLLNNTIVAIAAGGSGGGGGGNVGTTPGENASATPSTGANSSSTGQNGQGKDGDGGGGGGGGGGKFGGVFGGLRSGDQGALAGGTGASFVASVGGAVVSATTYTGSGRIPPSIDGYTVTPTFATGGVSGKVAASGTSGTPGHMIVSLEPVAMPYVKVDGVWKPVTNAYIKTDESNWVELDETYIKVASTWRLLSQDQSLSSEQLAENFRYGSGGTRAAPADGS